MSDPDDSEFVPFSGERFKAFYEAWRFGAAHSDATIRRWRRQSGIVSSYTLQEERFLRFGFLAAQFLEAEADRVFEPGAHFAVALITVSRIELLIQFHLVLRREEVKKLPYFKARAKRRSVVRTVMEMRLEEILALGRKCGFFAKMRLSLNTLDYVKRMGYPRNLDGAFKFLRDHRNHIHPGALTNRLNVILSDLPISPQEAFDKFYFNFAVVALDVLGELDRTVMVPPGARDISPF